jgi:L-2,4-diaminobutyric acid acetyltransferase
MKAGDQTSPSDLQSNRAVRIESPVVDDGVELWRIAKDSKVLDVNSRYAYLLWCRDFADTTVVARRGGDALGFVTGYRRPERPDTLFVWQVAVDERARGMGLAGRMLDSLVDQVDDVKHLETTITPDNDASIALFTKFAERWDAEVDRRQLFDEELLGDDHQPENRFRIGPFRARPQLRSVS